MSPRAVLLAVLFASALSGRIARGDPVPVVALAAGTHSPSAERVNAVASAIGPDALSGPTLVRAMGAALGESVPPGDPLAPVRADAEQTIRSYYTAGNNRELRRRMAGLATAMEAAPLALEARDDNHRVYLRLLANLGRMDIDAHDTAEADERLRRVAMTDPSWSLDPREFPPEIVRRFATISGTVAHTPRGELTIRVAQTGCALRVDGRLVGEAANTTVSLTEGAHRAIAICRTHASRVHVTTVRAGTSAEVTIDPDLDARIETTNGVTLHGDQGADERTVIRSAARIAAMVGAHRVVLVTDNAIRVVDAARASVLVTVANPEALHRWLHPTTAAGTSVAAARTPSNAPQGTASGGPVILLGVGAAGVVGAGVLYLLRVAALSSVTCNRVGSNYDCSAAQSLTAIPDDGRASTMTEAAAVSLGVGLAAAAGGLIWMLAGDRSNARVSASVVPSRQGVIGGVDVAF